LEKKHARVLIDIVKQMVDTILARKLPLTLPKHLLFFGSRCTQAGFTRFRCALKSGAPHYALPQLAKHVPEITPQVFQ